MGKASDTFALYAEAHGLESLDDGGWPGPLTPLLAKGGAFAPAARGALPGGIDGILARYAYPGGDGEGGGFVYNVVYTEIPESQPFAPRLVCERRGRVTDSVHYGFEIRTSQLWTESVKLNERFKVTTSPFQDPNWMRQLFSPTFIDWLGQEPPGDFSFELAYGSMLASVEQDDPDEAGLDALCAAAATVAKRIRDESRE